MTDRSSKFPPDPLNFMKLKLLIFIIMYISALRAAPSSIDSLGLPEEPETRYNVETSETILRDELVWYSFYSFFISESGDETKHGLWIERIRSRDRERFNTDFVETRKIYYSGEESLHSVVSTWVAGILRERQYIISEELNITLKYNDQGQEIRGPKASARGGRAKRERIIRVFNEIYKLNN